MPVWRKEHELTRVIVHHIGIVGSVICGTALCGQISDRPYLYQWGHSGSMSLPTAIVCLAYGIAMFMLSRGEARLDGDKG